MMKHLLLSLLILLSAGTVVFAQDSRDALVRDALAYAAAPSDSARNAFNDRYLRVRRGSSLVVKPHILYPDSTFYGGCSVAENTLPLAFGMVPDTVLQDVRDNLVKTLNAQKYKLAEADSAAVPYLLPLLSEMGRGDVAYFMTEDNPGHDCAGQFPEAVERLWRERYLAGVRADTPGVLTLKPDFSIQELDTASFRVPVPYGELQESWTNDLMRVEWYFTVPRGCRAEVYAPSVERKNVRHRSLSRLLRVEDGCTVWRVRPGRHHFTVLLDMPRYVVERSFVYKPLLFPQCHAPSICETADGELLAAFYGGSGEGRPDVRIWMSRKPRGAVRWSEPVAVAEDPRDDYTTENPVLFRIADTLLLFYKSGPAFEPLDSLDQRLRRISFWRGCVKRSYDCGHSWSEADTLSEGVLGTAKNKPVFRAGRIIGPSGLEDAIGGGKHIQFDLSDDYGRTWQVVKPCGTQLSIPSVSRANGRAGTNEYVSKRGLSYDEAAEPLISLQPAILEHGDGSLQALCRSNNGFLTTTWSSDNGSSWSPEVLTEIPSNRSGIDACTMSDGRFALVYTDFEALPGYGSPPRTPLKLAVSEDGLHFTDVLTIEDSPVRGYLYPAVIQGSDGYLHIIYNWRRYRMKYVKVKI